ncbi:MULTISPECIES: hypothetical protein [unclassified Streptomyces]|uniref:hypothetical protein n=1 Tax=unclassified Streptomyces TaxID=2593676 RepID=UPI00166091B8|nr:MULTISPECIES: hypothetical protein [unclassified Streptomyces]MBD0708790.1 hypothetical protein [Streptomyces sp. CBMA291]MBD0714728.1 hypothetical protein [Streptomyces sp. CBMA370]
MITTVGGGMFGVAIAVTTALASGGDSAESGGNKQATVATETPSPQKTSHDQPNTVLPTSAIECKVRDEVLYCTGSLSEIKLRRQRSTDTEVVYTLNGQPSRYLCWGHGQFYSEGNDIWYWTQFKGQDYWGNVRAVDLGLGDTPVNGLPECSTPAARAR